SSVATSTGCAHVGQDADAFGLEGRLHLIACERLLAAEETWSPFEDGDLLAAQPAVRLGELDARGPSAEDEEPPRHLVGSCRIAVVPRHDVREALDRRHRRHRPSRDDDRPSGLQPLPRTVLLDLDRTYAGDAPDTSEERGAHLAEPRD